MSRRVVATVFVLLLASVIVIALPFNDFNAKPSFTPIKQLLPVNKNFVIKPIIETPVTWKIPISKGAKDASSIPVLKIDAADGELTAEEVKALQTKSVLFENCKMEEGNYIACSMCITKKPVPGYPEERKYKIPFIPGFSNYADELTSRNIVQTCNDFEAWGPFKDSCGLKQIGSEYYLVDTDTLPRIQADYYGLFAWCDLTLRISHRPEVQVLNHENGQIKIEWYTPIKSSSTVWISKLEANGATSSTVEAKITGTTREHAVTYQGLTPGRYQITANSEIDTPLTPLQSVNSTPVEVLVLTRTPNPPTLTFVTPTPAHNSVTPTDTPTIKISSSKPLSFARLYNVISGTNRVSIFEMQRESATSFSYTFTPMRSGNYSISVMAIDAEENRGDSETRLFTVPGPTIDYIAPTPNNGTVLTGRTTTISIRGSEPLSSATLALTNNGQVIEHTMTRISLTEFSYTVTNLNGGATTFNVIAFDNQGDYGTTRGRTVTTSSDVTPPQVNFVTPTPASNYQTTQNTVTIAIQSNEQLDRAVLRWTGSSETQFSMGSIGENRYAYTVANLLPGVYMYQVTATDLDGMASNTETRIVTINRVPTAPVITFISPTPLNNSRSTSQQAQISIQSGETLRQAILQWRSASTVTNYTMQSTSATQFTYSFPALNYGDYSYEVFATDNEGDGAHTQVRTLTITRTATPPQLTFITPTPTEGMRTSQRQATISISSNENLQQATLTHTGPFGTTNYAMQRVSATQYTYTIYNLQPGEQTFQASALDTEGDTNTSPQRHITVVNTVQFVPPTPANGASVDQRNEVTFAINSESPIQSATLYLMRNAETTTLAMERETDTRYSATNQMDHAGYYAYYAQVTYADGTSETSNYQALQVIDRTWWNTMWNHRNEVTLSSNVGETLTNFPARIQLDTQQLIAQRKMQYDCNDLRVIDEDNRTSLSFEVERGTCNTNNTVIWVKIPTFASTHKVYLFYTMFFPAENSENIKDVWSNGYAGVWHFGQTGNDSLDISNATNCNSGTNFFLGGWLGYGVTNLNCGFTSSMSGWPMGSSYRALSAWAHRFQIPNSDTSLLKYGSGTYGKSDFGFWTRPYTIGNNYSVIGNGANGYDVASSSINENSFYSAQIIEAGNFLARINRSAIGTYNNVVFNTVNSSGGHLGPIPDGILYEMRLHNATRSIAWFDAEYGQTYSLGAEEQQYSNT